MGKCKKCGAELSDNVMFCKMCGTPVEKENSIQEQKSVFEDFQALSLEMRKISDQMIASYVTAMKSMEMEKNRVSENFQNEIKDLKSQLQDKTNKLENVQEILELKEKEIQRLQENVIELEKEIAGRKEYDIPSEENAGVSVCYNCGEPITDDMLFCGACGEKLK